MMDRKKIDEICSFISSCGTLLQKVTVNEYATYDFSCFIISQTEYKNLYKKEKSEIIQKSDFADISKPYIELFTRYADSVESYEALGVSVSEYKEKADKLKTCLSLLLENAKEIIKISDKRVYNLIDYDEIKVYLGIDCEAHID